MRLRVKCSECNREHLVKVEANRSASLVSEMNCLNCKAIIYYRIAVRKESKPENFGLEDLMNMFGMGNKKQ